MSRGRDGAGEVRGAVLRAVGERLGRMRKGCTGEKSCERQEEPRAVEAAQ